MFNIDITKIEAIVNTTIHEYGEKIFTEAMAGLGGANNVRGSFTFNKEENRAYIYTDEAMAAYIEFGTGQYAQAYLNGRPQEMKEDAIKFFVNGKGMMEAHPYLFPAFYKYKEELPKEIDKRIQTYFNSL